MAKRLREGGPSLPDFHLWLQVSETISPLRPGRRKVLPLDDEVLPIPPPAAAPRPVKKPPTFISMPSYQSDGLPGKKPRSSLEPNLRQRLMRGREEIDGKIDLHGMRQVEARVALHGFVKARFARGDRTLLVITGKGLKKLEDDAAVIVERGVLRSMLPVWLNEPDLAPLVAGWDMAAQGHGGEGAFYVRLRRVREYR